jgi:hypothetical protein
MVLELAKSDRMLLIEAVDMPHSTSRPSNPEDSTCPAELA